VSRVTITSHDIQSSFGLCAILSRKREGATFAVHVECKDPGGNQLLGDVGSVGDSYDNALAETINGLYKAEIIHRRGPWRSLEAVEFATLEWVDWFNNRRLLEPIGNIPPAEAEERYYAMLERLAMAA
jgi:transposase InsO family protein